MARTTLAVTEMTSTGLVAAPAAANADGHALMNDGDKRTFIEVVNGGGSAITVTAQTYLTRDGLAVADKAVTVDAGDRVLMGPFKPALYNRPDGTIYLDFSAVTDVTVAAYKLAG